MKASGLGVEQAAAARSEARHAMIISPPGCGKTEVLAHRAAFLTQFLRPNQRVLALTFTNRAKSNLQERLRTVLGHARMRRFVAVRNFHGHASQIVLAHGRTIDLDLETLHLPKTSTLRKALEATGADRGTRFAAETILREVKRNPLSDDEVLATITDSPNAPGRDTAAEVERRRQAQNQLHYEDLLRHAQRLLQIPAVGHLYRCHFGAVLVDEFQDLSVQQWDMARLTCADRQTYAGDPLQGIFSWAGAFPTEVEREIRRACTDHIHLHGSYRSSPKVLSVVNSVTASMGGEASLVCAQPERWINGGCSARFVFRDQKVEARELVRLASAILTQAPSASVGVICRSKWRREAIDEAFAAQENITVRRWDIALDDPQILSLITQAVTCLPHGATLDTAHEAVLDTVDSSDVDTLEQVDDAFETLGQVGASTARSALKSVRISDPSQTVGSGVHLLNAHTGKGQQFDWVFVVGLEENHLPDRRNNQDQALSEEHRLLLVMLSRAKYGLAFSRVQHYDGRYGRPYAVTASRWWSTIEYGFTTPEQVAEYLTEGF